MRSRRWLLVVWLVAALGALAGADPLDAEVEGPILPGNHTRIDTPRGPIHVWAPEGYRAESAALIVYVHGYHVNVDDAWWAHGLPEQFGAARGNALFVVPEAPSGPREPVHWATLADVVADLDGRIAEELPRGRVILIGHSGAYRTIEAWLGDPKLATVVLLDAGYGERTPYLEWVRRSTDHRLITVSSDTEWWCRVLHHHLPSTRTVAGVPARPEALRGQRIVHVRTQLDHWGVVTRALGATLRMLQVPPVASPVASEN